MPELPEVETSRRGIAPWLEHQRVVEVTVRERRLRWPVPSVIDRELPGKFINSVQRRAKYLLFETDAGTLMLHLGMSGSLRIADRHEPPRAHDHVDIVAGSGKALRFRDPRRFGSLLWTQDVENHPLIKHLGPEPLGDCFDGEYLHRAARGRRVAIKSFIMNASVVVGIGNIYANEALFDSGIHPKRRADRISLPRMQRLAGAIRHVLIRAIEAGGTTLRDFHGGDGEPGYFSQELKVYGRENGSCPRCGRLLSVAVVGQRSTFYCSRCQR
ncbi:MAG TPA: bifunctional DNA-formamidopyrimidine glycosylase/DNA-(apurinic or apyrimidinic site) lyase [Woeseiaceae bacterium]|nr:bifunctional DNA-formamidopyrimidine glycosylase/DNA-(apurinic or apyrimidinic site) lyase [Woeseiaceae bacterium]